MKNEKPKSHQSENQWGNEVMKYWRMKPKLEHTYGNPVCKRHQGDKCMYNQRDKIEHNKCIFCMVTFLYMW